MQDIYHTLGRIESHVHGLHMSVHNVQKIVDRLDQRISAIERQCSFWRGSIGILLLLTTIFGSIANNTCASLFFKGD